LSKLTSKPEDGRGNVFQLTKLTNTCFGRG